MTEPRRILLIEPKQTARRNLIKTLGGLGHDVEDVPSVSEALDAIETTAPEIILASAAEATSDFCRFIRQEVESPNALVLVFGRSTRDAPTRAVERGADAGFSRPITRDLFVLTMNLAGHLADARRETAALRQQAGELGERLHRLGDATPGQRFYHFEFFKHLLLVEIRRAKRYKYPLSVCLLEIDPFSLPPGHLMLRREIRAGVASAVSESIRDIDIPVYVGGERILLVLPHTPHQGAVKVAHRVARLIREGLYPIEDEVIQVTASIGVSGFEPGSRLSFAQLIQRAQKAMKEAQERGGDTVRSRL